MKKKAAAQTVDPEVVNVKLNGMLREIMGKRTASTIAKKCGVSVSTITRIRNGENKRGVSEALLHKIWLNREPGCEITLSELMTVNGEVSDACVQKENAGFEQDLREAEFLEKQIQKSMLNSGVFLRKTRDAYEILPGIELSPDMSYEIAFESGEKRRVLFFTEFYSRRRTEQLKKRMEKEPGIAHFSCRHYRTVMDFEEMRRLHSEYENAELVIVFNNEDDCRYNAEILQKLSDRDRVTLALIECDFDNLARSGRILKEVCLDGRKQGVLSELGMVR
ncbi:MAG: hypothetical protein J5849_07470 [Clostridia bacterium]|nr:hypothetical protein [Clostridia bacterium]